MPLEVFDYRTDVRNVFISPEIRSRFQMLEPGTVTARHSHDLGQEVWVVMQGEVEFEISGERAIVRPGQMIVAEIDQPHALRVVGDQPAIVYLSVTPHVAPTHTHLDEAGCRLPPQYATFSTRREGEPEATTDSEPLASLIERQVAAARALAEVASTSAREHDLAGDDLRRALEAGDEAAARSAVDALSAQVYAVYRSLRGLTVAWNELAPRASPSRG